MHADDVGRLFAFRTGWFAFYHEVTGDGLEKGDNDISPAGAIPQRDIYGPYSSSLPLSIEEGHPRRRYRSKATAAVFVTGNAPQNPNIESILLTENEEWFWRVDD